MSMLLQQIRRSTYSRKGTAAALTPSPNTFSRVFSTTNRALGPEKEETFAEVLGLIMVATGRQRNELEKLEAEWNKEWEALSKAKKELDFFEGNDKGRIKEVESEV